MSETIDEYRKELENWYSNPLWKPKVDHMSDEKVEEVLKRLRANRKWRLGRGK